MMKEIGPEKINCIPEYESPRNRRQEYIIRVLGIIMISVISVFVDYGYSHTDAGFFNCLIVSVIRTSLIWNGSMVIIQYGINRFSMFKETFKLITFQVLALSLLVLIVESGEIFVVQNYLHISLGHSSWVALVIGSLVITFMISSIYSSVSFFIQWKENLLRAQMLEQANLEARYDTLRNQVNPHFLFNSLNTLLVLVKDNPVASKYVESISEIMRYMLQSREKEVTRLSEELKIAKDFIFIQQSRFGDKLRVEFDVPDKYDQYEIPPLAIQMLLENALKHNVVSREHPLSVKVYVSESKYVVVENTIRAKTDLEPSTGVGLENISNRYIHLTGKDIIIRRENGKFVVMLPLFEKTIQSI